MTIEETEKEIISDFDLFDDWADKYQYIIELGQKLPKLPAEFYSDEYKVKGCQSNVWMHAYNKEGLICFEADSDSTFVKGLVSLLVSVLSKRTPNEIIHAELEFLNAIGLKQHLAQTRANGLASMIKQMKLYAVGMQG